MVIYVALRLFELGGSDRIALLSRRAAASDRDEPAQIVDDRGPFRIRETLDLPRQGVEIAADEISGPRTASQGRPQWPAV